MTIEKAIEQLRAEYDKAKDKDWIYDPVGYALYKTWRYCDGKKRKIEKAKENKI